MLHIKVQEQVGLALEEADIVIFLTDVRTGVSNGDRYISERLRQMSQPIFLAANKSEGLDAESKTGEFHELAIGSPFAISARTGEGVGSLVKSIASHLPTVVDEDDGVHPHLAVIGRPNVGKSTLINSLLGDERMIVADLAGTTRDSIRVSLDNKGKRFVLIDTAGVRRKSKVRAALEKFSVVKTIQAISESSVALLVLDAKEGLVDQDKSIAGLALQHGRGIVIVVNKWDQLEKSGKRAIDGQLERYFAFLPAHETVRVSALHGTGLGRVLEAADKAHKSAMSALPTNRLNRILAEAIKQHPPSRVGGRNIRPKYAHQGGRNPPVVVIYGSLVNHLSPAYKRYLARYFSRAFRIIGSPVHIETRGKANPYV